MNDRELLEKAAKAEGHGFYFDELSGLAFLDDKFTGVLWNPLHNDGDALRLAVKLGIGLFPPKTDEPDFATAMLPSEDGDWMQELASTDPYAATRRAIVRAAAELANRSAPPAE